MSGIVEVASVHEPGADVVFLYGLEGHERNTWAPLNLPQGATTPASVEISSRGATASSIWPEWLSRELSVNVSCLQYDARRHNPLATHPIQSASNLADRVVGHEGYLGERPVFLVTYSYGGIVAKRLVMRLDTLQRKGDEVAGAFLRRIAGVVFIAVPHFGSDVGSGVIGTLVSPFLSPAAKELKRNSPILRELNERYLSFVKGTPISHLSLIEQRRHIVGHVVNFDNANFDGAGRTTGVEDARHGDISHVQSTGDTVYKETKHFIRETLDRLTQAKVSPVRSDRYLPSLVSAFAGSPSIEEDVRSVLEADQFPRSMSYGRGHLVPNPVWDFEGSDLPPVGERVTDAFRAQMFIAVADLPSGKPGIYCYWSERWQCYLFPFRKDDDTQDEERAKKVLHHSRERYFCDAVNLDKRVVSVKRNQEHIREMWLYCFEFHSITMGNGFNGRSNHCWMDLDRLSDPQHREAQVNGDIIRAIRRHFSAGLQILPRSIVDWEVARFDDS